MMNIRIVVDANIIMAAMIKRGKTLELIYESDFIFYAPEILLIEIIKHK